MISIVVPCYNEEKNISRLVERFKIVVSKLQDEGVEIVLVNNGSNDETEKEIDKCVEKYEFIRKVNISENKGYGYGILEGLKNCTGDWVGWIHADLQLPPEAFLDFAQIIKEGGTETEYFYMKGKRKNRPFSDNFFTFFMGVFESVYLGEKLWDINAQPTMFHRSFLEKIIKPPYDFSLDLYVYFLARRKGLRIIRVPVIQQKREEGKSSWNNGMKSRVKFIQRTLNFSKKLKEEIRENERECK